MGTRFKPGDHVIYRKSKHSARPGPRADNIQPSAAGELYSYSVDKFWTVTEVDPEGNIVVTTRRGKKHVLDPNDLALRKARWWDRLFHRERFPEADK